MCDIITACSAGCDSCIMSGAGFCDGPRCGDGYYINSNFLCTSKYCNPRHLVGCQTVHNFVYLAKVHEPLVKHDKNVGCSACLFAELSIN